MTLGGHSLTEGEGVVVWGRVAWAVAMLSVWVFNCQNPASFSLQAHSLGLGQGVVAPTGGVSDEILSLALSVNALTFFQRPKPLRRTFGILLRGSRTISIAELNLSSVAGYISAVIGWKRQPQLWRLPSEAPSLGELL